METQFHSQPRQLNRVRAFLYNEHWAMTNAYLDLLCEIAEQHAMGLTREGVEELLAKDKKTDAPKSRLQMVGKTAVIPVSGPIFPKANLFTALSGASSAADISAMIDEAVNLGAKSVIQLHDSPGGSVIGGFELADKFQALRAKMPVFSVVEGGSYSLSYLIASQSDRIYITRGSGAGSISVIKRMSSDERMQKNAGIDSMTISSGSMKQLENRVAAFGGGGAAEMTAVLSSVMHYHGMFVDALKRARPKMNADAVSTGETWVGQQAIDAGLADEIGTLQDALNLLS